MNIDFYENIPDANLPHGAIADTHLFLITINDVKRQASELLRVINDTAWINELGPIGKLSYERVALKTIDKLVDIFKSVDSKVKQDFGEFLVSMSSGQGLQFQCDHQILPLSELWKEKEANNHGFDFHTVAPSQKFAFGEAKYASSGNSYTTSAEQAHRFLREGKDGIDAVHLVHFNNQDAVDNLLQNKRGCIVAFSINSDDGIKILRNTLSNKDIIALTRSCDELYIIGVKS